ncbi:MAG: DPP IV N-terminal domain-containing protein [Planctomycetota bacterium]
MNNDEARPTKRRPPKRFVRSGVALGLLVWLGAGCHVAPQNPSAASAGQVAWAPGGQVQRITLEQTSGRGAELEMTKPAESVAWAGDGRSLVRGERWEDARTGAPVTPADRGVEPTSADSLRHERLVEPLVTHQALEPEHALRVARRAQWSRDLAVAIVTRDGQLYAFRDDGAGGMTLKVLGEVDARPAPELSPDGKWVAFGRGHDLVVADTAGAEPIRLSEGGNEELLYGRLDWVYQEEVFGRGNWQGVWWNEDSTALAFLRLDESRVPTSVIADDRSARPQLEHQRYPKAGEPNPTVDVAVWRPGGAGVTWCDLGGYPEDRLVVGVSWDGARLVLQIQDRTQTELDLVRVDEDGRVASLVHESSPSWVNVLDAPHWLADGSFLWRSERTGFAHLYHYEASGELRRALTTGEWTVRRIVRVDETAGVVWCVGAQAAIEQHLYRVDLAGGGATRITQEPGTHDVDLDAAGTLILDRFSSVTRPPQVRLLDRDGAVLRSFAAAELDPGRAWAQPELHRVRARDGALLDALLIRPHDFDPGRAYPVWLSTYSGPASPSVMNRWQESLWEQFLAQEGFLVLRANVRSASGESQRATATCYRRLGVQELEDLEDVVGWLCAHPWADASRVGITGWSYGGFMAAFALTHSTRFRLGVAGAGVYDWRCYDTIYTERYMSTPQLNPTGYDASSCVLAAKDLAGHLVIVHGTRDDNVHLQNAMQLVHALQKAGKDDFELMLYPGARHGLGDPDQRWHLRRLTWRAMQEWLATPHARGHTSAAGVDAVAARRSR